MPEAAPDVNLLTVRDVAEWLRRHENFVRRLIKNGELDYVEVGSRGYRITEEAVRDYLDRQRTAR